MATIQRLQHASVPMPPNGHEEARRFYSGALGMEEVPPPVDLQNLSLVWFLAGDGGQEIHCFADDQPGPNSPGQHVCLQVDDLPAFSAQLSERGVTIEDAQPIRGRPRCFIHDPFGNRIELTQIISEYR